MADPLLLEDGTALLLEDGTPFLLEEAIVVTITKNGGYDAQTGKCFIGERMKYWPNFGGFAYWGKSPIMINTAKNGKTLSTSTNAIGPNINGYYDMRTADGTKRWSFISMGIDQDSGEGFVKNGVHVLRWRSTDDGTVRWGLDSAAYCSLTSTTHYLWPDQTEADYDGVTGTNDVMATGTWAAGSLYSASDVLTLTNGATVTVNTVDGGGGVLTFSVDNSTQTVDSSVGTTETSTGGGGSGFTLTPQEWNVQHRREYTVTPTTPVRGCDEIRTTGSGLIYSEGSFPKQIELLQPGQEAYYDAGQILHQTVIDDWGGGRLGGIRTMGLQKTNNCQIHNYSDYHTWENISWRPYASPEVCAKMAQELECGLWWNAPAQGTIACVTSALNAIKTLYPTIAKFILELGNETWASSAAFKDGWRTLLYGNVAWEYPTVDSATGLCTLASHGYSFGTVLGCFSHMGASESAWPLGGAGVMLVMPRTVDTFDISYMNGTIIGATNAATCVVTIEGTSQDGRFANGDTIEIDTVVGMTELNGNSYTVANKTVGSDITFELQGINSTGYGTYTSGGQVLKAYGPTNDMGPLHEDVTTLLVKNGDLATQTNNYWGGYLSAELFNIGRPIFGEDVFVGMIAGQRANPGVLTARLAVDECLESYDKACAASYYKYVSIAGPRDYLYNMPEFSLLIDNQDETDWDGVGDNGSHTQGSGYFATEQLTMTGGAVVTVNTVGGGGEVLTFSVDRTNDTGNHGSYPDTEVLTATGGSGSGFTLTVRKNNTEDVTTNREKLDWMIAENGVLVLSQQQANIDGIGCARYDNYEGADHQGSVSWTNEQQGNAIRDWGGSPEAGLMDKWWGRQLALTGIRAMAYHTAYSGQNTDGVWGMQYWLGDSSQYKYTENNIYFLADGAPQVEVDV